MKVYRFILVFAFILGFVSGCGKDDKDHRRDWGNKEQRTPAPKPGHVLVNQPDRGLDPWEHWKKGQHDEELDEELKEREKRGRRTPAPKPGHVLVK